MDRNTLFQSIVEYVENQKTLRDKKLVYRTAIYAVMEDRFNFFCGGSITHGMMSDVARATGGTYVTKKKGQYHIKFG